MHAQLVAVCALRHRLVVLGLSGDLKDAPVECWRMCTVLILTLLALLQLLLLLLGTLLLRVAYHAGCWDGCSFRACRCEQAIALTCEAAGPWDVRAG